MSSLVTTAELPHAKRFAFWRDAICDTFFHLDFVRTSDQPFFGELATTRVKDVSFSRVRSRDYKVVRTPLQVRQAREELLLISLQLSGTFVIMQDGREATLRAGDIACFDSARPYSLGMSEGFEQLSVHMPRDLWVRRMGPTEQLTARAVRGNTRLGALAGNVLREVSSIVENTEPVTAHRLLEVSLALVATALGELISQPEVRQSSGRIALLYRAKAMIEENLHDPDLNPEMVTRALRISERYLQDLFREEGTTVSNWIWERRLEKCRRDLSDPLLAGRSVTQIAFGAGFSNMSHFARRFKSAFDTSASEFRREQRLGVPEI